MYLTRLSLARRLNSLSAPSRLAWEKDGPRITRILQEETVRITKLLARIRRAYRTKPIDWLMATFEHQLSFYRERANWFSDQCWSCPGIEWTNEFDTFLFAVKALAALCTKISLNL